MRQLMRGILGHSESNCICQLRGFEIVPSLKGLQQSRKPA